MKKTLLCSALLAALMSVSGGAQAALVSQGGGVVLDNVNNLLWYTDGNSSREWYGATNWAAGLTPAANSVGSWSLATGNQFNLLVSATGGADFYAANATLNSFGIGTANYWLAETFQKEEYGYIDSGDGDVYYGLISVSEGVYLGNNQSYNVGFSGEESGFYEAQGSLAVAQYSATAPSAVPIPAAAWLMASGLGALGVAARKRKAQQA